MKKRLVSLTLAFLLVCSCFAVGTIGVSAEEETVSGFLDRFRNDATLVFDDEFDGDKIDETKWSIETGWGRVEDSFGTVEDGNYAVEDGHLTLRAYEKVNYDVTNGKASYKQVQSGEVSSKAAWGDGLIEIRAKLPKGKGVYPAIWTMGRDYDKNSCKWPWSGEIDIMEAVGLGNSDDKNYDTWQTLHTARPNTNSMGGGAAHVATGAGDYATPSHVPLNDDYHTFWVYFDKQIMVIGVDNAMMDVIDLSNPNLVCFKEWEQWLILGLQMGGLASTPVRTTYSVWEMLIDYVRVYRFLDTEKYKDYQIFEAEDLETSNSIKTVYSLTSPTCINNTNMDDIVVNFEDIEPGTYDVYSSYIGTTSANNAVFDTYLNGSKTGTFSSAYESVLDMKDCYMGRVTLEEKCSFEARMKYISGKKQALNVDKFMLVKTDAGDDDKGIVVNKSNEITTYDSIEVSTADELVNAYSRIKSGGTITLKNDITMTGKISVTKDCTLDLNNFTLSTGELDVAFDTAASLTINFVNGKIVTPGKNGKLISFFKTGGDKMAHTVNFENLDVNVTAKTVISFLSGYYARCGYYLKNCTFDFSESENDGTTNLYLASSIQDKSNGLNGARMTNLNVTSVTIKGNGNNTPFLLANYNGEAQSFILGDCTVENCKNLLSITGCDSKKVKVTLANDTFTNLGALTDTADNLAFITVATNNTVYDNDDSEIELAQTLTDFKITCVHEYSTATCTKPSTCKYCGKTTGASVASHTPGEPEIIQHADCCRPEKTKITCTVCGEVLSEEITAPASGHDFTVETVGETCTTFEYYRKTCNTCGYVVTTSTNNNMTTFKGTGHVIDEDSVVDFDNCKDGKGYRYTCKVCGKENLKKVERVGRHQIEVTSFTPATESAQGSITYGCKTCEYTYTKNYDYGTNLVTLDGVQYVATAGCYATPYITPDDFLYYQDGDGNKYARDEVIEVSKDMTLTTVTDSEHVHTPDSAQDKVVPPTCSDDGYTEHVCSVCNQKYKTDIISATGIHTYVENTDSKYLKSAANCHSKAVYYKSCSACDHMSEETFEVGELNPNNHEGETEVRNAKAATCKEDGYTGDTYCKACDTKISSGTVITKGAHDKSGEWQTDGTNHWKVCSVCGEEIEKAAHSGGTATCKHKAVCSVCGAEHGELSPNNHEGETEVRNAKAATCKEDGYTGDTYCKACDAKISSGTVITKGAHDKSGEWQTDGTNHWKVCSVCGEEIEKAAHSGGTATCKHKAVCSVCGVEHGELNPNNHEGETEVRNAKAATCKEDGYTGDTYCKACDAKISSGTVISAKGHTEEIIKGKEATCLESGLTDGKKCSVCGEILVKQTEIPAKGHTYVKVDEVPATYESDGVKEHYECSICGKLFDMDKNEVAASDLVIPKLEQTVNYGDLNGDGKINLLDLIAMRKHLAKWSVSIDEAAADCNADGKINLLDLILLRKYLAKWNVVFGPQK